MEPDDVATTDLGTFESPTAAAVVSVLRRRGCPAWANPAAEPGSAESLVTVPVDRRDEALTLLAAHMEDIAALTGTADRHPRAPAPVTTTAASQDGDEGSGPIVLERLRRVGLGLAVVLAPLLVVTLAAPSLPLRYALVVFVAGLVLVTYWRNRADR